MNIANQIITNLVNSDVVVADITDYNPNVLWELGVRDSYENCTIVIAEKGTKPPFDFNHKGFIFYNGDHLDNENFKNKFHSLLKDCLENPKKIFRKRIFYLFYIYFLILFVTKIINIDKIIADTTGIAISLGSKPPFLLSSML